MANFFEKLKRGMKTEMIVKEEKEEEEKTKEKRGGIEKIKKLEAKSKPIETEIKKPSLTEKAQSISLKSLSETKKEKSEIKKESETEKWLEPEGQLAVDVYQTESELIVQSAIAGVKPENLNISLEGDILTIEGERKKPFEEEGDYFYQECYWGKFSRQIILPTEIDPGRAEASLKDGVFTIRMPKIQREKKRKIIIK